MNIIEAAFLLRAGAQAVRWRDRDIPTTEFAALISAARAEDPTWAADAADLLALALTLDRPRWSMSYRTLADNTADLFHDIARRGGQIPVDAGLCPCITVRLWHPAVALACALIGTPNDDQCAAVLEAMS